MAGIYIAAAARAGGADGGGRSNGGASAFGVPAGKPAERHSFPL